MDETTCISRTVSGAAFGAATGANAAAAPRINETMKSFMLPVCDFRVIHAIDGLKHPEEGEGNQHWWIFWAPLAVTLTGFLVATFTYFFNRGFGKKIADSGGPLHSLFANKWYFDEIYNATLVRGTRMLGDFLWKTGDKKIIDGLGPNGVAGTTLAAARRLAKGQSGFLYHYAFVMLIGVLGFTLWIMIGQGGL